MDEGAEKTENPILPKQNGGARPGSGRKPSLELLKNEAKKLAYAEFWVELAENKAIPRLKRMMDNPSDEIAWKPTKEVLDRAFGKPRESVEHTGKDGERIFLTPQDVETAVANLLTKPK
jgi:hypothetical protein